ncbi:MAG: hypothetical protein Q4C91_10125 [Eubacteriales bacterium]|nr:hypothetical protein [Eubacteriales bacterium]
MKKAAAILCAVTVTFSSMAAPVYANPSIGEVNAMESEDNVNIDSEYTSSHFLGRIIKVVTSVIDKYRERSEKIVDIIDMLQDQEVTYTTKEILEKAGVVFADESGKFVGKDGVNKEFKTIDGNIVDPTELEPVTTLSSFEYDDGMLLENGRIEVTVPSCEALVGTEKEDVVIVQIEDEAHEELEEEVENKVDTSDDEGVYFIEPKELESDTGKFTAEFPCTGPFFATIKKGASSMRNR